MRNRAQDCGCPEEAPSLGVRGQVCVEFLARPHQPGSSSQHGQQAQWEGEPQVLPLAASPGGNQMQGEPGLRTWAAVFLQGGRIWAQPRGDAEQELGSQHSDGLSLFQTPSRAIGCEAVNLPFASCLERDQHSHCLSPHVLGLVKPKCRALSSALPTSPRRCKV